MDDNTVSVRTYKDSIVLKNKVFNNKDIEEALKIFE